MSDESIYPFDEWLKVVDSWLSQWVGLKHRDLA
jgi:hypothetical protein